MSNHENLRRERMSNVVGERRFARGMSAVSQSTRSLLTVPHSLAMWPMAAQDVVAAVTDPCR